MQNCVLFCNKGRTLNCRSFILLSYCQIWIKSTPLTFSTIFLFLHNMVPGPPIWNQEKISALTLFHRARTYAIWNSLALWPDTSISGSRPSTFPASSFRPKKTSRFTNCFRHFKNTNAPRALWRAKTHDCILALVQISLNRLFRRMGTRVNESPSISHRKFIWLLCNLNVELRYSKVISVGHWGSFILLVEN